MGGPILLLFGSKALVSTDFRGKRNLRLDCLWVLHSRAQKTPWCKHNRGSLDPSPSSSLACAGAAKVAIYWVLSSQHKVNIFSSRMRVRARERSNGSAWGSALPLATVGWVHVRWEPSIRNTWGGGGLSSSGSNAARGKRFCSLKRKPQGQQIRCWMLSGPRGPQGL